MPFTRFNFNPAIERAVYQCGYQTATPIQSEAIPMLLKGQDILGCAQTGTGKTAAFALPILQMMNERKPKGKRPVRTLVLAPTRELALQITDSFKTYGKHLPLRTLTVFGGVPQKRQTDALKRGVDILVATPGRLLDLVGQGFIHLNEVQWFVLDEADRMLDMGMLQDVRRIIRLLPDERQTMFFSATMPREIAALAGEILKTPQRVHIEPEKKKAAKIDESLYYVNKRNKVHLLMHLLDDTGVDRALVFSRTKHGANRIVKKLVQKGYSAQAIHGNKSQSARQEALANFKKKKTRVLVATDIAARGIDVDDLSHVINYDLPEVSETYVHRIGRTGRAGRGGTAIAFCDHPEKPLWRDIRRLRGRDARVVEDHPYPLEAEEKKKSENNGANRSQKRPSGNRSGRNAGPRRNRSRQA